MARPLRPPTRISGRAGARPGADQQEVVARRLALLGAELRGIGPARDDDESPTHTAIRSRDEPPPMIPEPGRHAHRRGGLPRIALGPGQVAVVAVLAAIGLAVTAWWAVRSSPEALPTVTAESPLVTAVGAPHEPATTGPIPTGAIPTGQAPTGPAELVVDVAGKVRRPGIAVLPPGSRVVDALEAAGGARPGVDLTSLNLARPLVDGEQLLVGVQPIPGVAASAVSQPGVSSSSGALVNLNTADQAGLESLPEVGPVTAQAIISWRDEHGGFTAVDELLEVDGIGEATLARVAPHVTL